MSKWVLCALLLMVVPQAWGADRYASTSGSGTTCSLGSPCTISQAISGASAGDTIYMRAGTYAHSFHIDDLAFLSGTSYSNATTIQAYPSESVTIRPSNGFRCMNFGNTGAIMRYFIFKDLICDGVNTPTANTGIAIGGGDNGGTIEFLKFDNVEVKNFSTDGIVAGGDDRVGTDIWITGGSVHDGGTVGVTTAYGHCWYVQGERIIVENSLCYNYGGYGFHQPTVGNSTPNDQILRNSVIHHTGQVGSQSSFAVVVSSLGSNAKIYNNVFYSNMGGIDIQGVHQIYSNVFYNNGVDYTGDIGCCYPAINHVNAAAHSTIKNNLIIANQINSIDTGGSVGAVLSNNITSGTASDHFVNAAGGDFHLKSSSAAIDAGTDLGPPYNTDIFSVARPQGAGWDVGAAEFQSAAPLPQPPTLVLAMGFNELSGSAPQDSSGNSNHGTFSSTGIGDDYARADSADLGANWDGGYTSLDSCQIVSNALRPTTAAVNCLETWNANSFTGNQFGEILIKTTTGSMTQASVILKSAAPPTFTFYRCVTRRGDGSAKTRIQRWDAGVLTESTLENASGDWVSGDRLRCTAEGGTVKAYKNGALILTYTDSSPTALGGSRIGASCLADDSAADCEIESFSGGDLNTGGVAYTTSGKYGRALVFDGTGSVTVADSSSLDFTTGFTLAAWVYPTVTQTDYRAILVKNYRYYLYATTDGSICGAGSTAGGVFTTQDFVACHSTALTIDTWTHLAVVFDGNVITLYKNGTSVASQVLSATLSATTGTLQIGASEFGENFVGRIDEVRLYNFARTQAEITTDMNTPIGVVPPAAPTGFKLQ